MRTLCLAWIAVLIAAGQTAPSSPTALASYIGGTLTTSWQVVCSPGCAFQNVPATSPGVIPWSTAVSLAQGGNLPGMGLLRINGTYPREPHALSVWLWSVRNSGLVPAEMSDGTSILFLK